MIAGSNVRKMVLEDVGGLSPSLTLRVRLGSLTASRSKRPPTAAVATYQRIADTS